MALFGGGVDRPVFVSSSTEQRTPGNTARGRLEGRCVGRRPLHLGCRPGRGGRTGRQGRVNYHPPYQAPSLRMLPPSLPSLALPAVEARIESPAAAPAHPSTGIGSRVVVFPETLVLVLAAPSRTLPIPGEQNGPWTRRLSVQPLPPGPSSASPCEGWHERKLRAVCGAQ